MAENGGWIKLHRKIVDNWIWEDAEYFKAWVDLLMMVNREDKQIPFNGHIVTVKRGQRITSIYKLANRWHWDRRKVVRYLALLEEAEMCTTERTTNGTTITIVNYSIYQDSCTTNGTTKRTTNGTTDGTTDGTQTRSKEIKNVRSNSASAPTTHTAPTLEEISKYCEANGISTDTIRFYQYNNAKGWKMDWKEALTAWIQREKERDPGPVRRKGDWRNFEQRQAEEEDELERQLLSME